MGWGLSAQRILLQGLAETGFHASSQSYGWTGQPKECLTRGLTRRELSKRTHISCERVGYSRAFPKEIRVSNLRLQAISGRSLIYKKSYLSLLGNVSTYKCGVMGRAWWVAITHRGWMQPHRWLPPVTSLNWHKGRSGIGIPIKFVSVNIVS